MSTALAEKYLGVRAGLELKEKDPLSFWHFAVPRLKEAINLLSAPDPIDELHARSCNKGTKTESLAALTIACLQKRKSLDGIALPQWRGKVEAACLVMDFKQQLLSVQPAFLRLLGKWPHHARYNGEVLSSLHVRQENGDDNEDGWSVCHFLSQENRRSGIGVRADLAVFDEPPAIEILRELRKAAHAGRRGIRLIFETPTIRRQWAPLREEYGDTPRGTITRISQDIAEVRWSLDDVADWVLSAKEKAALKRYYASDPLRDARLYGDYIDTSGSCPFHLETLLSMLRECRDPEVIEWRVSRETPTGQGSLINVPVEVWEAPKSGKSYYIVCDPASGTEDQGHQHDPLGIHVLEMGPGDLVARFNGYVSPYSLGILAAGLARQYNDAVVDVEVNDRWGVNVIHGLHESHYGNIAKERRELKPGEWSDELGFHNTGQTRPVIIGAVQSWIESWRAGARYGLCPSRKVIECLMDCILDQAGKIVGAPGVHDEDLILRGQGLRRAATRSGRLIPELQVTPLNPKSRLARLIQGRPGEEEREDPLEERIHWPR